MIELVGSNRFGTAETILIRIRPERSHHSMLRDVGSR
jgi:hypothetical protein